MRNTYKIAILGSKRTGKTTLIEEAIYGNGRRLRSAYEPSLDDVYCANVEIDKKIKEKVYFYDYAGIVRGFEFTFVCNEFFLYFRI